MKVHLLQIRAANMFHCSLAAAFSSGEATFFNVKERHQVRLIEHPAGLTVFVLEGVGVFGGFSYAFSV